MNMCLLMLGAPNYCTHMSDNSLSRGCCVLLHGLMSATEYNGMIGTLRDFCETSGRWEVFIRMDPSRVPDQVVKGIRVREANMRRVVTETVTERDIYACIHVKPSSGKGNGLFATEHIQAGTTLVKTKEDGEYPPIFAPRFVQFSFNKRPTADISTAWGLTLKLLQSSAIPSWFDKLHVNEPLVERVLKDLRDSKMIEIFAAKFPTKPVRDVFGKAVTNHICPGDGLSDCILDYHASVMNHSNQPNAVLLTRNGIPAVTIIVDVNPGEEIMNNYDAAGGEGYTRDW